MRAGSFPSSIPKRATTRGASLAAQPRGSGRNCETTGACPDKVSSLRAGGRTNATGGRRVAGPYVRIARDIATWVAVAAALLASMPNAQSADAPDGGGYRILTYRDGREIEIIGVLNRGVSEALARRLKDAPQAEVIHLNSFGGLSFEGWRLFELIRSRGLVTYASGWCYSACTTAFLGGRERLIAPGARLGFHKPARSRAASDDVSGVLGFENVLLSSYVDIPEEFVRKAQSIPHDSMWYPDLDELRRANVVTGVADPDRFASTGFGDGPTAENVAAALEKISPYDAVRRLDPAAFEAIRDLWLAAFTGRRDWDEVSAEADAHLGPLFEKYLPRAASAAAFGLPRTSATRGRMSASRSSSAGRKPPRRRYLC